RISDGNPPDTFQANGGWDLMAWVLYNDHDAGLTQLQQLDPSDWMGQVPPPVLDSVRYKGAVYAVPLTIHRVNTFFYNKKVFADAGIQVETLTSLAKVFEAAEMVK